MRFTLYYDGPLPSGSKGSKVQEKQAIREKLYPQFLELWKIHPALPKPSNREWHGWSQWDWPLSVYPWWEKVSVYQRRGIRFVPLVRSDLFMVCELSIIFLRPGYLGQIIQGGDIDNRIKTFADALSVPQENQLNNVLINHALNDPFFCLLGDDSLVSSLSIRTAQLLAPVTDAHKDDVRLIVDVDIKITKLTDGNISLVSG